MNKEIETVVFTIEVSEEIYSFYEDVAYKMKKLPEEIMGFILIDTYKRYKKKHKKKYKIS